LTHYNKVYLLTYLLTTGVFLEKEKGKGRGKKEEKEDEISVV